VQKTDYTFFWQTIGIILSLILLILYWNYKLKKTVKNKTSELQKYTNELEKQKELYDLVFDNSQTGVLLIDIKSGRFIDCNSKVMSMLEYNSKEDILNTLPSELSPKYQPDGSLSEEKANKMIEETFETKTNQFEWIHLKATKEAFWVEVTLTLVTIDYEQLIHVGWRDINDKKKAEIELKKLNESLDEQVQVRTQELKNQKEEFESIFNNSKDGIATLDLTSRFLECNQAYIDMLGYSKEELKEKTCIELTIPEEKEKSIAILQEGLKKGYIENFEKTCVTKNGSRVIINMSASLLPDKKRFLIVSKNVTALKLLEDQSKLASMGEMIGNIAHQWRQPLSMISTASTGVLFYKDIGQLSDDFIEKEMNLINDNAQYLSKTIDDFRDFIKGERKLVEFNLDENIQSFINLVQGSIKSNDIHLIIDTNKDIHIQGYPNELIQCLINIFNNAKDALKSVSDERYIFIKTNEENNSIKLTILDNAGGIDEKLINRIFEPYFTTKHQSQGTGLGLSMTRNLIVEGMRGELNVENHTYSYNQETFTGALFTITLPKT
jgi:PAS domain S-box-containing protein